MFIFVDAFFCVQPAIAKKNEPDACVFCLIKSNFACKLIYCLEELLDDLFTFPKEGDHCDFQNFLNEKHFPLEKKEQ